MTKKILALVLAGLMLLAALVACGTDEPAADGGTDAGNGDDVIDTSEQTRSTQDDLGEYDFNGGKYKILSRESTAYEFDEKNKEGSGGDNVSKKVAERNAMVEQRFNVKIETESVEGAFDSTVFTGKINAEIAQGYTSFALVSGHANRLAQLAVDGAGMDMNKLEGVNYTKQWWSEAFYNECLIDDKTYLMIGDIAYSMYERMEVVYFNQTMIDANNLCDDMYALVATWDDNGNVTVNKEWTYEKMKTMALTVPNATTVDQQDEFGLIVNSHAVKALLTGMEVQFTKRDENGRHRMVAELDTNTVTIIDNLVDDVSLNNTIRWNKKDTSTDETFATPKFAEGKVLFYVAELRQAAGIVGMKQEFGVLPTPLKDGLQESYHTGGRDEMSGVMVLQGFSNVEMAGVITEALAMYSYQLVRPEYYEVTLKTRYTDDVRMGKMLDFIRKNYTIPFCLCYTTVIGNPYWPIEECYDTQGTTSIVTKYNTNKATYSRNLNNMYNKIDGKPLEEA